MVERRVHQQFERQFYSPNLPQFFVFFFLTSKESCAMITKLYTNASSVISLNIPYSLIILLPYALYKIIILVTMLYILQKEAYDF